MGSMIKALPLPSGVTTAVGQQTPATQKRMTGSTPMGKGRGAAGRSGRKRRRASAAKKSGAPKRSRRAKSPGRSGSSSRKRVTSRGSRKGSKFAKGSPAAKRHMARLRAMRKK